MSAKIHIFTKVSLFFIIFVFSYAKAESPSFVWRVDPRSYDDIFNNRFHGWGKNNKVYEHLAGISCFSYQDAPDSIFISTTASYETAVAFAEIEINKIYNRGNGKTVKVYIYKIRATDNFYDGVTSLKNYAITFPHIKRNQIYEGIVTKTKAYDEWLAVNAIENSLIKEVYPAYIKNGEFIVGTGFINPLYLNANTKGSSLPYDAVIHDSVKKTFTWVTNTKPLIGVCSALHNGKTLMNKAYPYEITEMFSIY